MNISINQIDPVTWSINEETVRFFLLAGKEKALLIDSGMQTENAEKIAASLTSLPLELLNTHADRDHIRSNCQFKAVYMHPSETSNYYHSQGQSGEIIPVWDKDVLDLGERELEVIHLPGHTPGSIAVLDIRRRMLFSGDPIQDGRIFMFGIQREMHAYRHSLKKLENYMGKFDKIYPSHGTCPINPDMIGKLYDASGDILEGKVRGTDDEVFGQKITVYDMGTARFLCDREGGTD